MKRTRPTADDDGGDGGNKTFRYAINQAAMCSVVNFFDHHELIGSYHDQDASRAFEGHYNFFCGVGGSESSKRFNSGKNLKRPYIFNTKAFLRRLRGVLTRMRAYLRMFGGVAAWAVKDMALWYYLAANARTAEERDAIGMPFGVLEANEYTLEMHSAVGHDVRYVVVPTPEAVANSGRRLEWKATFIDFSMHTMPVEESDLSLFEKRASKYLSRGYKTHGIERTRIPRSPFYSLNTQSEELDVVLQNLKDADWLTAHPRPMVRIVLPPPLPLDKIPESDLYRGGGTTIGASLASRNELASYDLQLMANVVASVQLSAGGPTMKRGRTVREQQKQYYRYPDMTDDYAYLNPNMELARYSDPHVLNDYDKRLEEFNDNVARVMGGNQDFSKPSGATDDKSKAKSSSSNARSSYVGLLVDQEQQFAAVEREQKIYTDLFEAITEFSGIQDHDVLYVSQVIGDLQKLIEERERMRRRAKHPANTAKTAKALLAPPPPTRKERDDEADEELLESLRVRLRELKIWLEQQTLAPGAARLTLAFENKEDDIALLEYLTTQQASGIVSAKTLEKQAQIVYDDRATFREPPEPATAAGGVKKKKKKTTA